MGPRGSESVKKAKAKYDQLKKDGFEFFEVEKVKGSKRVKRWSKNLGEIVASPGVASKSERKAGQTRGGQMSGGPNAELLR